jgi:hypothetical protein
LITIAAVTFLLSFYFVIDSTAYIKLGEYHTAKETLEKGASLAQNDFRFIKLIKECDQHITGM